MTTPAAGPLDDEPAPGTCGARTRQGTACRRSPVPGTNRCRNHGGASPQVTGAIRRRNELARIVDSAHAAAAAAMTRTGLDVDPAEALLAEVARSRAVVEYLAGQVDALAAADDAGGLRVWAADSSSPLGRLVDIYAQERRHLTRTAKAALDAGIGTRTSIRAADVETLEDALAAVVEAAHRGASLEECRTLLGRILMVGSRGALSTEG